MSYYQGTFSMLTSAMETQKHIKINSYIELEGIFQSILQDMNHWLASCLLCVNSGYSKTPDAAIHFRNDGWHLACAAFQGHIFL